MGSRAHGPLRPWPPMSLPPLSRPGYRFLTTLGAWLAAYLVVMLINIVWGSGLASLPTWASALILSGVLATFMVNVAMPAIHRLLGPGASDESNTLSEGRPQIR